MLAGDRKHSQCDAEYIDMSRCEVRVRDVELTALALDLTSGRNLGIANIVARPFGSRLGWNCTKPDWTAWISSSFRSSNVMSLHSLF